MKIKDILGLIFFVVITCFFYSCASHKRSNIVSNEDFVVELKKTRSRGALINTALEGLFMGAKYFVDNSAKKLYSSYNNSISVNDYYNNYEGDIVKSYEGIELKKYAKPVSKEQEDEITTIVSTEIKSVSQSRGNTGTLAIEDILSNEAHDMLNFHAKIGFESDPENPGITRLSFDELRIFFSKTKVFKDENLNAKVLISIEGQWRANDGSPKSAVLIEQEYDFKNLKYGYENQISEPIKTKWYYDIPIFSDLEDNTSYGVIKVNVQLEEYEGKKSKYINQLPSILSDNKSSIIKNGSSTINKIIE